MMRSATAFLPDSMMTFMNLDRSTLPNFGSGRISRLGTSRRRGMDSSFNASVGQGFRPAGDLHRHLGGSTYTAAGAQALGPQKFDDLSATKTLAVEPYFFGR